MARESRSEGDADGERRAGLGFDVAGSAIATNCFISFDGKFSLLVAVYAHTDSDTGQTIDSHSAEECLYARPRAVNGIDVWAVEAGFECELAGRTALYLQCRCRGTACTVTFLPKFVPYLHDCSFPNYELVLQRMPVGYRLAKHPTGVCWKARWHGSTWQM